MTFTAAVLADSISPSGHRLTTLEVTFPRFVLAEFNTHRVLSRNSASSRAIPIARQLRRVLEHPFVPLEFGTNQPGMQAGAPLRGEERAAAEAEWLLARDEAVRRVLGLIAGPGEVGPGEDLGAAVDRVEATIKSGSRPAEWLDVHKQVANRLLEPFMWHTVIVTATEWENFFNLRCHRDAQPEIRRAAESMRTVRGESEPAQLGPGEWHLPLVRPEDRAEAGLEELIRVSAGRCARVSYLTHAGRRDLSADVELCERLLSSGHMSPLEHPARPLGETELRGEREWCGNLRGWRQFRKTLDDEANPLGPTVPARADAEPEPGALAA